MKKDSINANKSSRLKSLPLLRGMFISPINKERLRRNDHQNNYLEENGFKEMVTA